MEVPLWEDLPAYIRNYLAGKPAPKWIAEGTSHLEREREIDRLKQRKPNKETSSVHR